MSRQPSSNNPDVYVKKPKWDIYTSMLFISLAMIIMGIVFLCLEMDRYDWKFRKKDLPKISTSAIEAPADVTSTV